MEPQRCPTCNALLGWPGVPLNAVEQQIVNVLREHGDIYRGKQLSRLLKYRLSESRLSQSLSKLRTKLNSVGLGLDVKPYRIVYFASEQKGAGTTLPGTTE